MEKHKIAIIAASFIVLSIVALGLVSAHIGKENRANGMMGNMIGGMMSGKMTSGMHGSDMSGMHNRRSGCSMMQGNGTMNMQNISLDNMKKMHKAHHGSEMPENMIEMHKNMHN